MSLPEFNCCYGLQGRNSGSQFRFDDEQRCRVALVQDHLRIRVACTEGNYLAWHQLDVQVASAVADQADRKRGGLGIFDTCLLAGGHFFDEVCHVTLLVIELAISAPEPYMLEARVH